MTISYPPQARQDLREQVLFLRKENKEAARDLHVAVKNVLKKLAEREFEGPRRRLLTGQSVRTWPVLNLRISYQRRKKGLFVLRIHHQARAPLER